MPAPVFVCAPTSFLIALRWAMGCVVASYAERTQEMRTTSLQPMAGMIGVIVIVFGSFILGGGNIRVNAAFGPVSARTSGGNVSARLNEQPKGECALKTSGGNVSVTLAQNLAVDLNAQNSGGSIHSDFPGDINKQKTRLVAQSNGGGPGLVLQTSGGNVDIRKE